MAFISVITPVYKTAEYIHELYSRTKQTVELITDDFEIIFVNDGSPDNAWDVVCNLADSDGRVKGINLSRNFGQHYAITAGIDNTDSEWVVVMDSDLQDRPEEIMKLFDKTKKGYYIVFGRRYRRNDKWFRRFFSRIFYFIFNYFTDRKFDNTIANFSIVNKKVINVFKQLREHSRSYPLFLIWTGFEFGTVNVEHDQRKNKASSYSFKKLIGFAIESIVFQSDKPLKLFIKFGLVMSLLSLLVGVFIIIRKIFFEIPILGWASIMVSIYFIAGLLFFNLGLIGLYLSKTHDESKNRPLYVIKDIIGLKYE